MFDKLPELFDQNFAVGYFLPASTFVIFTLLLWNGFGLLPIILTIDSTSQSDVLVKTATIILISWLGGILLLAINGDVFKLLEGYGRFNPFNLLGFLENHRYKKLQNNIAKLDEKYLSCISQGQRFPTHLRLMRNRLMHTFAERFPAEEYGLLPTSFGNTVRAFEVYPQVMYGLDPMPGWVRLLAIIPKEYSGLVSNAKAQVDFWVNLCLLSVAALIEYLGLEIYSDFAKVVRYPILILIVVFFAYSRAQSSAIQWGSLVKSSYDIFLPELRNKLGFSNSTDVETENKMWQGFSQAIIYLKPEYLPNRSDELNKGRHSTKSQV
jgi:hypothetical protein